jgi:hypothetical protein
MNQQLPENHNRLIRLNKFLDRLLERGASRDRPPRRDFGDCWTFAQEAARLVLGERQENACVDRHFGI